MGSVAASELDESNIERLSLRLSKATAKMMKDRASEKGVSINEFVRLALGTEIYLIDQVKEGAKIMLERPDRPPTELVLR